MATRTITAMFPNRNEADRAATAIRANTGLAPTSVKVLPEQDTATTTVTDTGRRDEGGFMNTLRNFFMPEEDRCGYAEGMRRGSVMVAVETDDAHAHQVMDALEEAGAVDLDAEEAKWRNEGWQGQEPSSSATTSAAMIDPSGETTIPPLLGATAPGTTASSSNATASSAGTNSAAAGNTTDAGTRATSMPVTGRGPSAEEGTEERIPLVEENLRVGKRQVIEGRVRIRSYVVETPVSENVHLRDERVEVERRPVDRPLTSTDADPFREREIEATETREEAVVSKDARVREELVMHKSVQDRDETVRDTVRRTEVRQDQGEGTTPDESGAVRNPDGSKP